jgi:HNH endonuclease
VTPLNTAADFWLQVQKSAGCWEWQGCRSDKGYGFFKYQGKQWRAHRLSWTFLHGPIPAGKQLNHHCDNPACVNPDHLYLGDQKQNRRDAMARGRTARGRAQGMHTRPEARRVGEHNGNSKLTFAQILEIRRRFFAREATAMQLAREHGVADVTIYQHVNRPSRAVIEHERGSVLVPA